MWGGRGRSRGSIISCRIRRILRLLGLRINSIKVPGIYSLTLRSRIRFWWQRCSWLWATARTRSTTTSATTYTNYNAVSSQCCSKWQTKWSATTPESPTSPLSAQSTSNTPAVPCSPTSPTTNPPPPPPPPPPSNAPTTTQQN